MGAASSSAVTLAACGRTRKWVDHEPFWAGCDYQFAGGFVVGVARATTPGAAPKTARPASCSPERGRHQSSQSDDPTRSSSCRPAASVEESADPQGCHAILQSLLCGPGLAPPLPAVFRFDVAVMMSIL